MRAPKKKKWAKIKLTKLGEDKKTGRSIYELEMKFEEQYQDKAMEFLRDLENIVGKENFIGERVMESV